MTTGYLSRTQFSVGQGGFHGASLDIDDETFSWVYDCGSTNTGALTTAIDRFAADNQALNFLFLSHLDEDHSNGVDRLMASVAVHTVVLPYLSPFLRAMLLVEASAAPLGTRSATSALQFLTRPTAWFLERGANRVLYVLPTRDDEGALPPREPGGEQDSNLREVGVRAPTMEERHQLGAKLTDNVGIIERGGVALCKHTKPIWELVPYTHDEPDREETLRTAVAAWLGLPKKTLPSDPKWMKAIKSRLSNVAKRDELADLYLLIRKNRNLSSMSLYTGPTSNAYSTSRHHWINESGWMGTGDMHLNVAKRLRAFETFYAQRLERVHTFMLPHHGSRKNIRSSFIMNLGESERMFWVAAYGQRNSYSHPDKHLLDVADEFGVAVRVTERSASEFVQSFALHVR